MVSLKMNIVLHKWDVTFNKERDIYNIKNKSILCKTQELHRQKKNLYQVLSLESHDVSFQELKKAYRVKALQLHPDVCPPSSRDECTKQFMELQKAYEVLSDPNSRRMYDNELLFGESFTCCHYVDEQKENSSMKVWEMQLVGLRKRSEDRMARTNRDS